MAAHLATTTSVTSKATAVSACCLVSLTRQQAEYNLHCLYVRQCGAFFMSQPCMYLGYQ
jgi:hypothetical protein